MPTVAELLGSASGLSAGSGRRDVEILLCHCLGKSRAWLYTWPEEEVEASKVGHFESLLASRQQGHPVAHLTGRREFWTLNLQVNRHTLIPRPETETLVEWALALAIPEDAAALDLGTGSGAIALALASEKPGWCVAAVDSSEEALAVARQNGSECGLSQVHFSLSDWYETVVGERFHLLVSNPPYIEDGDVHLSTGDLRFEPARALKSGNQGLADLATLVAGAPDHLYPGGWLLLEHGYQQGEQVRALLAEQGFCDIETRTDIAGLERVSGGCWHAE